jgi:kinesin family protein 5
MLLTVLYAGCTALVLCRLQVAGDAEGLLQQARSADPSSPEPLQALASLRYEQGNSEEALQLLKQSMKLWFRQQSSSDGEDDEDEEIPEAEVRCCCWC